MCFSATASFAVAAATAVTGLTVLRHVKQVRELPLAFVPLLFAVQQVVEGVLWLRLSGVLGAGDVAALSFAFLFFAKVVWPTYTPLAVWLIEPDRRRRRLFAALGAVGAVLSLGLLIDLLATPPSATISGRSIDYTGDPSPFSWQQVPYMLATALPLVLSSHRTIRIFGALVLLGFLVSAYAYVTNFVSLWCFFAAANSTLLYFHFKRVGLRARLVRH